LVSPFAHIVLQVQLGRAVSSITSGVKGTASPEQISGVQTEVEDWIATLPSVFKFTDPNISFDKEHPYLAVQRHQLHITTYMVMLHPLKPYLAGQLSKTSEYDQVRAYGVACGLNLLKAACKFFGEESQGNAKFHFLIFCLFDTATILCSAIIHDREGTLPQREQVLPALENAIGMLHQLSSSSKTGAMSHKFLFDLFRAIPRLSEESSNLHPEHSKRRKINSVTQGVKPVSYDNFGTQEIEQPINLAADLAEQTLYDSTFNNSQVDVDHLWEQSGFGTLTALNIEGLEQLWDWETLNLDGFLDHDAVT